MNDERAVDIARRMMAAAELFAERNPYADRMLSEATVRWYVVPEAEEMFDRAIADLIRENPHQLSYWDTVRMITYMTLPSLMRLALGVGDPPQALPADKAELEIALKRMVLRLANQNIWTRLRFVIENIIVDGDVPHFLGVELVPVTDDERQGLYDDRLMTNPQTNALGFADVVAPGDSGSAFDWGVQQVERFLNLLQGCGSDRVFGKFFPIRMINRNPVVPRTPYRRWEGERWSPASVRVEYGNTNLRMARVRGDLLSPMSESQAERLVAATASRASSNRLLTAIAESLSTLGEACKPNLAPTRMLLASSALEMLVGERPGDDVSFRGQTAAVAERATFLIGGQSAEERQAFDRRLRTLYGKGSAVRHGGRPDVGLEEVVELAGITRRVAFALLDRPDLTSQAQLDAWVQRMRYTTEGSPPPSPPPAQ